MRKYLTEFLGTFFLVLTIGLAVGAGTPFAPIAIGSALMIMVYMGGHISGAHYNPAVTLAVLIRGKIDIKDAGIYWVSQILGGVAAAAVAGMLVQDADFTFLVAKAGSATPVQALAVEILFTFALALVVLNVATAKGTEGNSFYGLAIGFTVLVGAFAGGPISGGAFNPAVGIGPNVINGGFADLWIYIVGPLVGGALAGFTFNFQNEEK
ncbi:MAG: aquaporin [Bacteroidia bacterium]|nr:aquaporin [Bacteroidia bacterium]